MSETSPSATAKINELAGNDPRWQRLLTDVAVLLERSERQESITEKHTAWQVEHDKKDEVRFTQGDARMAAIEKSIEGAGGIRSGVNDYNENLAQIKGAKKLFLGAVAVVAAIGAVILFAVEVAKHFLSKTP